MSSAQGVYRKRIAKRSRPKPLGGQIRDLQRFLEKRAQSLSASARKKKEAQLQELLRMKAETSRRNEERTIAKGYRMVKFFERRKLERKLQTIIDRGDKGEDRGKKEEINRDLKYIRNYPKGKKYIALFPTAGHTKESRAKLEEMRKEIEETSCANNEQKRKNKARQDTEMKRGKIDSGSDDDFFVDADAE